MRWKLADMSFFGHLAVLFVGRIDRMKRIEAVLAIGIRASSGSHGRLSTAANVARDRIGGWDLLAVNGGQRGHQKKQKRIADGYHCEFDRQL